MAYFNNAFRKTFVMSAYVDPVPGTPTAASGALTSGQLSLYDAKTWAPLDVATPSKCQFIIASGAPYVNDKVGPFHGGYKESIKSKGINPKFISKVWGTAAHAAQNSILHIGTTPFTVGTADCCPTFLCGENYHLRVDVKGSPALRMLNHQAYQEVTAYTGCCPDGSVAPVAVDPALVMIDWAKGIYESVILTGRGPNGNYNSAPFIIPVVTVSAAASVAAGEVDALYYPPGTSAAVMAAGATAAQTATGQAGAVTAATWDTFASAFAAGDCAGLTLVGAYEETKFGDCTFQPSDFYGTEPLRLYASEVDLNGDPCEFTGICIVDECKGRKAEGLGETVARDFILSESYRQVNFATDLRIREITQGNDMLGTGAGQVDRTASYDRLFILHSIPRYNNPSGTFDNDQYLLEIAGPAGTLAAGALKNLKDDIDAVTAAVGNDCVDQAAQAGVPCAAASIVVAL